MTIDEALLAGWNLEAILRKVRREVILAVLEQQQHSMKESAIILGIHRNTLERQMKQLNIRAPGQRWRRAQNLKYRKRAA